MKNPIDLLLSKSWNTVGLLFIDLFGSLCLCVYPWWRVCPL